MRRSADPLLVQLEGVLRPPTFPPVFLYVPDTKTGAPEGAPASGRTVRYTRDDLRTMLRRILVPSSLKTSSVPNKAHRRFSRFQVFI